MRESPFDASAHAEHVALRIFEHAPLMAPFVVLPDERCPESEESGHLSGATGRPGLRVDMHSVLGCTCLGNLLEQEGQAARLGTEADARECWCRSLVHRAFEGLRPELRECKRVNSVKGDMLDGDGHVRSMPPAVTPGLACRRPIGEGR